MKTKFFIFFLCIYTISVFAQEGIIETLKFRDADIKVVLEVITKKAIKDGKRVNIIISPDVRGSVTVDLKNIDWEVALDSVLWASKDLGKDTMGSNIILVDTLANIAKKRELRKLAQKAQREEEAVEAVEKLVRVLNFAKVEDIKGIVEGMLTPRGKLSFDIRSNTIIIIDIPANLRIMENVIKRIDKITPQVSILTKVIETNLDTTRKIGVKWNLTAAAGAAQRPVSWPFTHHSDTEYLNFKGNGAFPNPATTLFSYGTLDLSDLASTLDIIFSDMESKLLSEPSITTLDNHTAMIKVVTEDPVPNYTYSSEQGNWEIDGFTWIEYGVSLEVTPQINEENIVTLEIKPKISDTTGDRTFTSGGQTAYIPILYTQTTSTKVMVKDKETLVIAGLIKHDYSNTITKIPFLGDLPFIGRIFKHENKTKETKNLLIFITPHIVTPKIFLGKGRDDMENPIVDSKEEEASPVVKGL